MDPGIYEVIVTESLRTQLESLERLSHKSRLLHRAEAADRIALHLGRQIQQSLEAIGDSDRVQVGIEVARDLIARLAELVDSDTSATPVDPGEVLHAILERRPDGTPQPIAEPLIPLLDTTLLTNAPGEPVLLNQLDAEIDSADAIDVVMAFIRRSGINPLLAPLRRHCERGRPLRVLTTTYTGSTERAALDQLTRLGADVRISYDVSTTRLHAKAWIFHRRSGFSTAYVGSSNLTHSAQVTGLEWNVRASSARNPDVLAKFEAVFESYWQSADFVPYDPNQFDEETERAGRTDTGPVVVLSPIELRLEPFQERLLEQISLSRGRGHHRNLLVAATGTGKTVMAAVDYARLRGQLPRSRLLFVAHRDEILDQSLATFRYALRDASFGEKWVGGSRPQRFEHVFASIQSLNATDLDGSRARSLRRRDRRRVPPRSGAVVPKAPRPRHAQASCSASPPRPNAATASPILHWFDDRIAAELRLWDAIDQQRLSPFVYFGIHDGLDLTDIPWRRGQGYDVDALSNLYTSTDAWARIVLQEVLRLADESPQRCAPSASASASSTPASWRSTSIRTGVPAVAVWGDSSPADREAALRRPRRRQDPRRLLGRPLQRGCRRPRGRHGAHAAPDREPHAVPPAARTRPARSKGKTFCTVLDFVGTHRREFRFDRRYRALLGGTRRDVERAVQQGFPFLPAGCHMQLDEKASEIVLRSLREAIPTRWPAQVDELRVVHANHPDVTLSKYLNESGLDLADVYDGSRAGRTCARPLVCRSRRPGRTRSSCARRSAVCCTSTTTSASPPTGDSSSRQVR